MVDKSMSIGEVLTIDRNTVPIFMAFGMHCLGCPHATAESIEDACMAHGVDADRLVDALNEFLAKGKADK
jgi:hybrid cluster-associated redox disulfide protein